MLAKPRKSCSDRSDDYIISIRTCPKARPKNLEVPNKRWCSPEARTKRIEVSCNKGGAQRPALKPDQKYP